jgi:hypothetical protein
VARERGRNEGILPVARDAAVMQTQPGGCDYTVCLLEIRSVPGSRDACPFDGTQRLSR